MNLGSGFFWRLQKSSGATMVETALFLPLFLFGILFFVWLGVTWNEKAALNSGLGTAIRTGATRANFMVSHQYTIADVHDWITGAAGAPSDNLKRLLVAPDPIVNSTWSSALTYYNSSYGGTNRNHFPPLHVFQSLGVTMDQLPPQYIYSLVYIYDSLQKSIGITLRFPCDPFEPDGQGCVRCRFQHPENQNDDPWTTAIPTNIVAVRCDYRPANFIATPLYRMLSLISRSPASIVPMTILTANKRFLFSSGEIS